MLTEHLTACKKALFPHVFSLFMDEEENVCGISKIYYSISWCVSGGQKLNPPFECLGSPENSQHTQCDYFQDDQ